MDSVARELRAKTGLKVAFDPPSIQGTLKSAGSPDYVAGAFTLDCRGILPGDLRSRQAMWQAIAKASAQLDSRFAGHVDLVSALYTEIRGVRIFFVFPPDLTFEIWQFLIDRWELLHRTFERLTARPDLESLILDFAALIVRISEPGSSAWSYLLLPQQDAPPPAGVITHFSLNVLLPTKVRIAATAFALGRAFEACEEWDEGARLLEHAVETETIKDSLPTYRGGLHSLGLCYLNLGLFDLAVERLRRRVALDQQDSNAHFTLAYAHILRGERDASRLDYLQAEERLTTAVALKPDYFDAWYNLACVLAGLGRRSDLEEKLSRAPIDRKALLEELGRDRYWANPPPLVDESENQPPPDGPPREHDVFISYSSRNRKWVEGWLVPRLEAHGINPCVDYRDFTIGYPSVSSIEQKIQSCPAIVFVLTPDWVASSWANFESFLWQTQASAGIKQRVIPMLLEKCDIPLRLRVYTYVDLRDPWRRETQLARVAMTIRAHIGGFDDP